MLEWKHKTFDATASKWGKTFEADCFRAQQVDSSGHVEKEVRVQRQDTAMSICEKWASDPDLKLQFQKELWERLTEEERAVLERIDLTEVHD